MAAQNISLISSDVKALMDKRNEVENSICDLFKDANHIFSARTFANDKEFQVVCEVQRVCLRMLQSSLE